jgi:hypothetical protein
MLDIVLQCIYSILFPGGGTGHIAKLLFDLQKFVMESTLFA